MGKTLPDGAAVATAERGTSYLATLVLSLD